MTLTELRYIVAVAREKHFGRAAEGCFVSQPTLSVAIKKLEEELDVKLFERGASEVSVTPLGEEIVRQAQQVIEQAAAIKEIAKRGKDPVAGPLRVGVIYTIGPYLLPDLVKQAIAQVPQMPLVLQENFTVRLLDMLRTGELDCAILAEPFPDTGLAIAPLYDEPFMVAVPTSHPLARRKGIGARVLRECERVVKDAAGAIVELRCTVDLESLNGATATRRVKGTIHWLSASHARDAEVRLYDRLFASEAPDAHEDWVAELNPASLEVLRGCKVETGVANAEPGAGYQFERQGYFCADLESTPEAPVFNRTVTLKDAWARMQARG